MANANQHLVKAQSNRDFLRDIDIATRGDWAVVVAFYTAVHLVESLRALDGGDSQDHSDRGRYVRVSDAAIQAEFHLLYTASRLARYSSNARFYAQFPNDQIQPVVIDGWLAAVEGYVAGRTGTP